MDATMLMAGLTGITVMGILVISLIDCWPNPIGLLKLAWVKYQNN